MSENANRFISRAGEIYGRRGEKVALLSLNISGGLAELFSREREREGESRMSSDAINGMQIN